MRLRVKAEPSCNGRFVGHPDTEGHLMKSGKELSISPWGSSAYVSNPLPLSKMSRRTGVKKPVVTNCRVRNGLLAIGWCFHSGSALDLFFSKPHRSRLGRGSDSRHSHDSCLLTSMMGDDSKIPYKDGVDTWGARHVHDSQKGMLKWLVLL